MSLNRASYSPHLESGHLYLPFRNSSNYSLVSFPVNSINTEGFTSTLKPTFMNRQQSFVKCSII
ncbi:MAG: hypothetical protein AAFS12_00085 [Cyanobacteria bacterium J06632_19]